MNIFRVDGDGELVDFFQKSAQGYGSNPIGEFVVCYKINSDGSGIDVHVTAPDGKHRGQGEFFALRGLFMPPEVIMVEDSSGPTVNNPGWGDNVPPPSPPPDPGQSGQLRGYEQQRRRQNLA